MIFKRLGQSRLGWLKFLLPDQENLKLVQNQEKPKVNLKTSSREAGWIYISSMGEAPYRKGDLR